MKRLYSLLLLLSIVGSLFAEERDSVTFAVYGNSISTYYENYIPSGYAIYYGQDRELKRGIQVGDTWWMQLSRASGMTFLANSSWSGSRVAFTQSNGDISPFCSNARVVSLGRNGVPDVILIAAGTNDWGHGNIPLGDYCTTVYNDSLTFRGAYSLMLHKLQKRYPDTQIVCLSLFPRGNGLNDKNAKGWTPGDANTSIRTIAKQFGVKFIDCSNVAFSSNWGYYTIDQLHPTTQGHKLLSDCISRGLVTQGVVTKALVSNHEVEEAPCLLDLSFTEDGIVNRGTFDAPIGKRGNAAVFYDADRQTYCGTTKAAASDFFYATYDEDSSLAEAFNSDVTWETLVRLDGLANSSNSCERVCFLSNEQDGGWSFFNSRYAATFTYRHKSGINSSMKNLAGDSIMVPGKFYHMVVTMDRRSHIMRYYINGTLVCTGTRAGTDLQLPKCGTMVGKKGMWICLGGDCTGSTFRSASEYGAACTFVFARIYDGALSQKAAKALYNDYVRQFTDPQPLPTDDRVMDLHLTPSGPLNVSSQFGHSPIEMVGDVPLSYNPDLLSYEAEFTGERSKFLKYVLGNDAGKMNAIADAYSMELLCRSEQALPKSAMRPMAFPSGYGPALQMSTKGDVGYTSSTQGYKTDGTFAKTLWTWTGAGQLTDAYTHYVLVYDRLGNLNALYVDGKLKHSRSLTVKECSNFDWALSEWLAIGGDAYGKFDVSTSTGSSPFSGTIALARLWGRALSASDVTSLYGVLGSREVSFTFGSNGYVSACVPFATLVPEGCHAYIVGEVDGTSAYLLEVGQGGEVIPYGTPLILQGERRTTVTLHAVEEKEPLADVSQNLLVGTFAAKAIHVGTAYYVGSTSQGLSRATTTATLPAFSSFYPSDLKRSTLYYKDYETGLPLISQPSSVTAPWQIYDLSGRRLPSAPKGIYIEGGRLKVED